MKIGVLLYTYNRVDDARINLEIIRNVWKKNPLLRDVAVVHAFNGKKEWWPKKYLEDELLYLKNPGYFRGAEILLNEGTDVFLKKYPHVDYVVTLAADTWCVNPEYLEKVIGKMHREEQYLAVCAWGNKKETDMFKIGMSLDFNIVDLRWAKRARLFPLKYKEFVDRYAELFTYRDEGIFLERVFAMRFRQAIERSVKIPSENLAAKITREYIYHMIEREPVHSGWTRKMYWPKMGLITHHDPEPKRKILRQWKLKLGDYGNKLLGAKSLNYYNMGLVKTMYKKGKKNVGYGD